METGSTLNPTSTESAGAIFLERWDLLKNVNSPQRARLRNEDGELGGLLGDGSWFITTPNADVLYEPPVGDARKIVLRKNNLYGADDPLLWPQIYCDMAPHLACIPLKPHDNHSRYSNHIFMFELGPLKSSDFKPIRKEDNTLGKGHLTDTFLDSLDHSIEYLKTRITDSPPERDVLEPVGRRAFIDQQLSLVDAGLLFLKNSFTQLDVHHRHVLVVKRAWIYSIAWLDYMTIYRRKFTPEGAPCLVVDPCMGCFATNATTVASARSAGLPVWYLQPSSSFSDQVILKTADIKRIDETIPSTRNFPGRILFCGRNGDFKLYQSIQLASRNLIWGDLPTVVALAPPSTPYDTQPQVEDDEEVMPEPMLGRIISPSETLVDRVPKTALHSTLGHPYAAKNSPVFRWGNKKTQVKPHAPIPEPSEPMEKMKDNVIVLFNDLTGRFAPNTIPAFAGANLTIDRNSHAFGLRKKQFKNFTPVGYGFPPPHLITGAAESRANIYNHAWVHLRDAIVYTTESRWKQMTVLSAADWRELLNIGVLGDEYWTKAPPTKTKHLNAFNHKNELWKFAQDAIDYTRQNAPKLDVLPTIHPFAEGHQNLDPLTLECADETLYLLSVLNFRFDIIMLDMHFTLGYVPGVRNKRADEPVNQKAKRLMERHKLYLRCWYHHLHGGSSVFHGDTCLFWFKVLEPNGDWANPDWNRRYRYILGLVTLMKDWPMAKPEGFFGRCDALQRLGEGCTKLITMEEGLAVEREVIRLFCQTFYDVFGRPPVLHHKSKYIPDMLPLYQK